MPAEHDDEDTELTAVSSQVHSAVVRGSAWPLSHRNDSGAADEDDALAHPAPYTVSMAAAGHALMLCAAGARLYRCSQRMYPVLCRCGACADASRTYRCPRYCPTLTAAPKPR